MNKANTDEKQLDAKFLYWRIRMMYSMVAGYGVFYFVRKNISFINPELSKELGFTAEGIGLILGVSSMIYGVSKFANGILADILSPRMLMSVGLGASAIINLICGFNDVFFVLLLLWSVNSFFQGLGATPCARMLTNWFSSEESGRAWGIWNASHQIGAALIAIIAAFLIEHIGWEAAFYVPGIIALIVAFFLYERLRDEPSNVGMPPINVYRGKKSQKDNNDQSNSDFWMVFRTHILKNKMVWLVCFANFFVYIVRIGILDWGPRFLQESKGFSRVDSGWAFAAHEIAGLLGALLAGFLSDKFFKGRRGPVSFIFMFLLVISTFGLIYIEKGQVLLMTIDLILIGFLIYGPQMLVAVAAADFAAPEASATAVGLTGLFGYVAASLCGYGTGYLVTHYGWNAGFWFWIISGMMGMIFFWFTWNHGGQEEVGAS